MIFFVFENIVKMVIGRFNYSRNVVGEIKVGWEMNTNFFLIKKT